MGPKSQEHNVGDQPIQNHIFHARRTLKLMVCEPEHCPDEKRPPLFPWAFGLDTFCNCPQQVATVLSTNKVTLFNIINICNAFCFQQSEAIAFHPNEMMLAFSGAEVRRDVSTAWIASLSLDQSDNANLSWIRKRSRKPVGSGSNNIRLFLWGIQPDTLLIKYQKIPNPSTRKKPSSRQVPYAEYILNSLTKYANSTDCLVYSQSPIIHHHVDAMLSVFSDTQTLAHIQDSCLLS